MKELGVRKHTGETPAPCSLFSSLGGCLVPSGFVIRRGQTAEQSTLCAPCPAWQYSTRTALPYRDVMLVVRAHSQSACLHKLHGQKSSLSNWARDQLCGPQRHRLRNYH